METSLQSEMLYAHPTLSASETTLVNEVPDEYPPGPLGRFAKFAAEHDRKFVIAFSTCSYFSLTIVAYNILGDDKSAAPLFFFLLADCYGSAECCDYGVAEGVPGNKCLALSLLGSGAVWTRIIHVHVARCRHNCLIAILYYTGAGMY